MAVDSRNKRFSLMGFGAPTPTVFPNPDGAIDTAVERAQYLWLYAGLTPASVAAFGVVTDRFVLALDDARTVTALDDERVVLRVNS